MCHFLTRPIQKWSSVCNHVLRKHLQKVGAVWQKHVWNSPTSLDMCGNIVVIYFKRLMVSLSSCQKWRVAFLYSSLILSVKTSLNCLFISLNKFCTYWITSTANLYFFHLRHQHKWGKPCKGHWYMPQTFTSPLSIVVCIEGPWDNDIETQGFTYSLGTRVMNPFFVPHINTGWTFYFVPGITTPHWISSQADAILYAVLT